MKVYLAGPMTGIPQGNVPAFDRAAYWLRQAHYNVVSPTELDTSAQREALLASSDGAPGPAWGMWGDCLSCDVHVITSKGVDAVVVLPGWKNSKGALLETFVARLIGLPVLYYRESGDLRHVADAVLIKAHSLGGTS